MPSYISAIDNQNYKCDNQTFYYCIKDNDKYYIKAIPSIKHLEKLPSSMTSKNPKYWDLDGEILDEIATIEGVSNVFFPNETLTTRSFNAAQIEQYFLFNPQQKTSERFPTARSWQPCYETALQELGQYGLTKEMLLDWQQIFSSYHTRALKYLITQQNYSLKDALSYMHGLSYTQAIGIAGGLKREDVLAFHKSDLVNLECIRLLIDLKPHGLTAEKLLTFKEMAGYNFLEAHVKKLRQLVLVQHVTIDKALSLVVETDPRNLLMLWFEQHFKNTNNLEGVTYSPYTQQYGLNFSNREAADIFAAELKKQGIAHDSFFIRTVYISRKHLPDQKEAGPICPDKMIDMSDYPFNRAKSPQVVWFQQHFSNTAHLARVEYDPDTGCSLYFAPTSSLAEIKEFCMELSKRDISYYYDQVFPLVVNIHSQSLPKLVAIDPSPSINFILSKDKLEAKQNTPSVVEKDKTGLVKTVKYGQDNNNLLWFANKVLPQKSTTPQFDVSWFKEHFKNLSHLKSATLTQSKMYLLEFIAGYVSEIQEFCVALDRLHVDYTKLETLNTVFIDSKALQKIEEEKVTNNISYQKI